MNMPSIHDELTAKTAAVEPPTPVAFELHDVSCALDELHLIIDRLGNRLSCVSTELATPGEPEDKRDAQGSSQVTRQAYDNADRTWDACRRIESLMRDLEI